MEARSRKFFLAMTAIAVAASAMIHPVNSWPDSIVKESTPLTFYVRFSSESKEGTLEEQDPIVISPLTEPNTQMFVKGLVADGYDVMAPIVGEFSGYRIPSDEEELHSTSLLIASALFYDDGHFWTDSDSHESSSLEMSGTVDAYRSSVMELRVNGGTGTFHSAQGYALVYCLSPMLYKFHVYLSS